MTDYYYYTIRYTITRSRYDDGVDETEVRDQGFFTAELDELQYWLERGGITDPSASPVDADTWLSSEPVRLLSGLWECTTVVRDSEFPESLWITLIESLEG